MEMRIGYRMLCVLLVMSSLLIGVSVHAASSPGWGTVNGLDATIVKVTTNTNAGVIMPGSNPVIDQVVGGSDVQLEVIVQYGKNVSISQVQVAINENGVETLLPEIALTQSSTQIADIGTGDSVVHTKIYTGTWETLATYATDPKMVYNDCYNLKAHISYNNNRDYVSPVVQVQVKNLAINSIVAINNVVEAPNNDSTHDFFTVGQGQSGDENPIQFVIKLHDYAINHSYNFTLTIRNTENCNSVIRTISENNVQCTVIDQELTHTMNWNIRDDNGNAISSWGGYYTFDLSVCFGNDTQSYRSTTLRVSEDKMSVRLDENNECVQNIDHDVCFDISYRLDGSLYGSSLCVYFYQNGTSTGVFPGNSDSIKGYSDIAPLSLWIAPDHGILPPSGRAIFCAVDTSSANNRNKCGKRMLCKNNPAPAFKRLSKLEFMLTDSQDAVLNEYHTQYDNNKHEFVNNPSDVKVIHSWPANTSGKINKVDKMNKYTPRPYVENGQPTTTPPYWVELGPIPLSNYRTNTVAENDAPKAAPYCFNSQLYHCYRIVPYAKDWMTPAEYASNTKSANIRKGMLWCDNAGNPQLYDDPGHLGQYRLWRFWIYGINTTEDSISSNDLVLDGTPRTELRIHEDGNYFSAPGTHGCIGVTPGCMNGTSNAAGVNIGLWDRLNAILTEAKKLSNDSDACIPLEVYDVIDADGGAEIQVSRDDSSWIQWGATSKE